MRFRANARQAASHPQIEAIEPKLGAGVQSASYRSGHYHRDGSEKLFHARVRVVLRRLTCRSPGL